MFVQRNSSHHSVFYMTFPSSPPPPPCPKCSKRGTACRSTPRRTRSSLRGTSKRMASIHQCPTMSTWCRWGVRGGGRWPPESSSVPQSPSVGWTCLRPKLTKGERTMGSIGRHRPLNARRMRKLGRTRARPTRARAFGSSSCASRLTPTYEVSHDRGFPKKTIKAASVINRISRACNTKRKRKRVSVTTVTTVTTVSDSSSNKRFHRDPDSE